MVIDDTGSVEDIHAFIYDSIAGLGEIEVYLVSKFQSCFIDDFGMSGSLLQYWKYVTQI